MFNRRDFLRVSGLSVAPALSTIDVFATQGKSGAPAKESVYFMGDGPMYSPDEYLEKLYQINKDKPVVKDVYGKGGSVEQLLKKFCEITGKESAIYMPTGTMANQLAISVLCGENTKAFVQDTSHVYRDEADSAQSVFSKRLIPLAAGKAYFTLEELQGSIEELAQREVFKSGIGAVSIENPVRRNDGQFVPLSEIKKISAFCKAQGYKLHLDGARIYLASAFSGNSVSEYASYFDTVYISLYKYLGAAGGAVLCGPKNIIDKMEHLVKVHGGVVYSNWTNAAMALHHLTGIEDRFKRFASQSEQLFKILNQIPELTITSIKDGTNISILKLSASVNSKKLSETLWQRYNIALPLAKSDGTIKLMVNDSLLTQSNEQIAAAFKDALSMSKV
ncbi:threonine aldolase family protein [Dyadobacter subterraneus]|uniref:Aminotransferase class I/II-fold pyridoxal phosphate-dependent enzyme n=1 Tax=Dyadobacter subterraneus TaxID=2773304 RepID=A0ABR9WD46_9BACT|nr:aminotransferase class I/II-fold pyridoxal phosphate-dependent enzyme [Dyadobacter subterraneus]MBE9463407.1 aminotransferase class I/II-fold pyridoxal phosphate-dependent enzyme [Dyadobacter subterraneus]